MEEKQFEDLVRRYQALVYTVCFQLTHSRETAEDLTQETFLTAYRHRDACRLATARPWLCRIAANKARDHLKSAARQHELLAEDPAEACRGEAPSAEEEALARLSAEALHRAVGQLHEPYLLAAQLHFLEGLPPGEVARRLGRPLKTVHTQLDRARKKMRDALTEGGSP